MEPAVPWLFMQEVFTVEVRNATAEDLELLGQIMSVSFHSAFAPFISSETLDACARPDSCTALLRGVFQDENMHFLIGECSGLLIWQKGDAGAEIVAIHSLPESWGSGLGHAMLANALEQMGEQPVHLWAFKENCRARRFYEKHGFIWDGAERVSEFDGALEVRYVRG